MNEPKYQIGEKVWIEDNFGNPTKGTIVGIRRNKLICGYDYEVVSLGENLIFCGSEGMYRNIDDLAERHIKHYKAKVAEIKAHHPEEKEETK